MRYADVHHNSHNECYTKKFSKSRLLHSNNSSLVFRRFLLQCNFKRILEICYILFCNKWLQHHLSFPIRRIHEVLFCDTVTAFLLHSNKNLCYKIWFCTSGGLGPNACIPAYCWVLFNTLFVEICKFDACSTIRKFEKEFIEVRFSPNWRKFIEIEIRNKLFNNKL